MIREAIQAVVEGNSLTAGEAAAVMEEIMTGEVTPAQFGAFVTALRLKGETVDEIAGLAITMRAKAVRVTVNEPVLDVVGTGGDGKNTFNISTATALVCAAAGLKVAKHGNRAASSQCGAADVLEAMGVKVELNAGQVEECIEKVGIGFMFAPAFHPATRFAVGPRREIGIRNVFNILGPLTNPALAGKYLLGVADGAVVEKMAQVLRSLGCDHALVVYGEDGVDEVSLGGKTRVYEVKGDSIDNYTVSPEDFGLSVSGLDSLKGGTAEENAAMLTEIFSGVKSSRRDAVLINTGAALYAGDKVATLKQGAELAVDVIDSGQAAEKLRQFIEITQSFT